MKSWHNTLISLGVLFGIILTGCSVDPLYDDLRKEEYTRSFIKTFGVVNSKHDWNMAQSAFVNLNLGQENVPKVKVYGKYNNKYYLVADLEDVSGQLNVPIDIPKECTELKVKYKGMVFFGRPNSTIDCCNLSRGVPGAEYGHDDTNGDYVNQNPPKYTGSFTKGSVTYGVTVQHTKRGNGEQRGFTDNGEYQYFNTQQMSPIVSTDTWNHYYSLNTGLWTDNIYASSGT